MKNEKEFKKRISEIAAGIAGNLNEYESGKFNLPDALKAKINSAVTNQKDMAQFILDMMKEIIAGEPGMKDIKKMSGWNSISNQLEKLAGEDSNNMAYDGMPVPKELQAQVDKLKQDDMDKLKENYERIKRK
jgi:thiamine biosynthesis protein ThiC